MAPPNLIGHYETVARIAATHTGEIYLSRMFGEPFAVKVFRPELLKRSFLEQMEKEKAVATSFSHPSAVKMLEVTIADRRPMIAMEVVWGQPWASVVRKAAQENKPLARELTQWIGHQVALLLQQAHRTPWTARESAGLLHGRLALNDILITYSGEVKVTGVGVGRTFLTLPLSTAKLPYRAPELFGGRVDTRADIYALGVTIHDAYTNKSLFKRQHPDDTRDAILQNEVPPLTKEVQGISREISAVVARMVAGSPDARPQIGEILGVFGAGIPSDDDARSALSEQMFALFPSELRGHRRMRDAGFKELGPDPYLEPAVRAVDRPPPKLDASALVEVMSPPPSAFRGGTEAETMDDGRAIELGDESMDLLGTFYDDMRKKSDPPPVKPPQAPDRAPTEVKRPFIPPAATVVSGPPPALLAMATPKEGAPSKAASRVSSKPPGPAPVAPSTKLAKPVPVARAPVRRVPGVVAKPAPPSSKPTPTPLPTAPPRAPTPPPPRAELEADEMVAGRYRVISRLGEGGMALVFKVQHTLLEKEMAMKLLRPEVLATPGVVERFEQEARSSSRLDDPNIVRVTDYGRTETGVPFLVMELLSGRSLGTLLKERGRLESEDAIGIIDNVLGGLEHAHGHDIVHRDMKPDNIMLVEKKNKRVAKIVDFGIAQVMSREGSTDRRLSQEGKVFGTPAYMAPEQATAEPVDLRTDLYAVGVILYEILSGKPPFSAESTVKLLTKVVTEDPPPLVAPQIMDTLLARLEKIIRKVLSKAKEDRYATATEFRNALRLAAGRTR